MSEKKIIKKQDTEIIYPEKVFTFDIKASLKKERSNKNKVLASTNTLVVGVLPESK